MFIFHIFYISVKLKFENMSTPLRFSRGINSNENQTSKVETDALRFVHYITLVIYYM